MPTPLFSSSISLQHATQSQYDVVVVGAGPAGSSAAYHLAKDGVKVLLVDRFAFPRDKACGDAVRYFSSTLEWAYGCSGSQRCTEEGRFLVSIAQQLWSPRSFTICPLSPHD